MSRERKTVILQVRVSEDVARFLKTKAQTGGMPVTELGGALLEYAAEAEANEEGEALLLPTVRQVVRQELGLFLERMFDFLVRTYMEAGTARRMVQAVAYYADELAELDGTGRLKKIKEIEERQWSSTWEASRRHFDGLIELKERMGYSQGVLAQKMSRLNPEDQTEMTADLSAD